MAAKPADNEYDQALALHGSVEDARWFIAWYESHEHHSAWDKTRYAAAKLVVERERKDG